MVWIHGGGNVVGSSAQPRFNGEYFVQRGGIVLVTINYRLGAFGFLHAPQIGASGNEALLDQIAALRWVRKEIRKFGGNPSDVTVFGQSAGGFDIAQLMGMEAAAGCFDRAIPMSGSLSPQIPRDEAAATSARFAEKFGGYAALQAAPAQQILDLQTELTGTTQGAAVRFGPVLDGEVIRADAADAIGVGTYTKGMPLLIGTARDEWGLWTGMDPAMQQLDEAALLKLAKRPFGTRAEEGIEVYRRARAIRGESIKPVALWRAIMTDSVFPYSCDPDRGAALPAHVANVDVPVRLRVARARGSPRCVPFTGRAVRVRHYGRGRIETLLWRHAPRAVSGGNHPRHVRCVCQTGYAGECDVRLAALRSRASPDDAARHGVAPRERADGCTTYVLGVAQRLGCTLQTLRLYSSLKRSDDAGRRCLRRPVVTPDAARVIRAHHPAIFVVDQQAAPAVFDLEAGRRAHIERRHPIVRVMAEAHRERNIPRDAQVERRSDVVKRVHFEHQVVHADGAGNGCERKAVMALIAVEKTQRHIAFDSVGQFQSEHVRQKTFALHEVRQQQHDVSETARAGDEAGHGPSRTKRTGSHRQPPTELVAEPEWIDEPDEVGHRAAFCKIGVAAVHRQTVRLQSADGFVKGRRSCDRPTEVSEVVALPRVDEDSRRGIVYAQTDRPVGMRFGDFRAQDGRRKIRPCVDIWRRKPNVAERLNHKTISSLVDPKSVPPTNRARGSGTMKACPSPPCTSWKRRCNGWSR